MIVLNATNEKITVSVNATGTSDESDVFCSFRTRTSTTFEAKNNFTTTNGTTAVDVCPVPGASEQNLIDYVSIFNNDTVNHTYTIQWTDGSNFSVIHKTILQAGEKTEYVEGKGWLKYDANGVPVVISNTITPSLNNKFVLSGALYETFDRNMCDEVNTAVLSTGRLSLQAIYLPAGTVVSSISFWSATTAAGTPTNQLFGLYDSSLNLLRSSSNDTTTAWAANSKKTLALTSTFTTTYSGLYYLGIMVTATTVPTLKGNTAKTGGQLNAAAPSMGGTSTTGLTTALPATAAAPGTVTTSFWGCVS